jgi:hypothetical protein
MHRYWWVQYLSAVTLGCMVATIIVFGGRHLYYVRTGILLEA